MGRVNKFKKLYWKKKIYISFIVILMSVSQFGVLGVSCISKAAFMIDKLIIFGFLFSIPQVYFHWKVNWRVKKCKKEKCIFILK